MSEQYRQKRLLKKRIKVAKRRKREAAFAAKPKDRVCGGCKLCCYVYPLPEFAKRTGTWCKHICAAGCAIHDQPRPPVCTDFKCLWLLCPAIPSRYRPDQIGIVVQSRPNSIVWMTEAFKGATRLSDGKRLIEMLVRIGLKVVSRSLNDDGSPSYRRYYDGQRYPVAPSWEELLALSADERAIVASVQRFVDTGESDRLWQTASTVENGSPRTGVSEGGCALSV